jgi:UDP-N-acetylmuramoyl-tripeptide--D-alanyl-D-alanine ligase
MAQALTPRHVSNALGLPIPRKLAQDPTLAFTAVVTDSRKIIPGCLFVAITGETFDGNTFVAKALTEGARAALCRTGVTESDALFEVPDTLIAFRKLAAAWRHLFNLPLALVGGSAGKTTTKELLSAILSDGLGPVLKTQASHNGFVGIPITLMELAARHHAAVIEVGIDEPGSMQQHFELVRPTVSVLTSIGAEHLEKLIDVETVAREEGMAFELALKNEHGGKIVVNLDDPYIAPWFSKAPEQKRLGFSLEQPASDEILHGRLSETHLQVEGAGLSGHFPLPLPGKHNAMNLLGAIATARLMGLDTKAMLSGLKNFKVSEGRSQLKQLAPGVHVLCDYYNSQPPSLTAAIELLGELSGKLAEPTERWACLGDMLELGPEELRFHRAMAPLIISRQLEHVLLFGERMKALADELRNLGYTGDLRHFSTREEMGEVLAREANAPVMILIKGSRGMKMEELWKKFEAAHA